MLRTISYKKILLVCHRYAVACHLVSYEAVCLQACNFLLSETSNIYSAHILLVETYNNQHCALSVS